MHFELNETIGGHDGKTEKNRRRSVRPFDPGAPRQGRKPALRQPATHSLAASASREGRLARVSEAPSAFFVDSRMELTGPGLEVEAHERKRLSKRSAGLFLVDSRQRMSGASLSHFSNKVSQSENGTRGTPSASAIGTVRVHHGTGRGCER